MGLSNGCVSSFNTNTNHQCKWRVCEANIYSRDQELLQEIDPDVVVNADRLQSQGIITTWNSDDDVASSHFYAPELSRNYGYVYQYFYPNRVGNMRISLRIEYPVI